MKFFSALLLLAGSPLIASLSIPNTDVVLAPRDAQDVAAPETLLEAFQARSVEDWTNDLEKRKGGGGGRGGGGGSSSGSKSGSSSSSSSGTKGSSSSSSGTRGVGPQPGYGGAFYGGGSRSAYRAGLSSPAGLYPRVLLPATAVGLFAGAWAYNTYAYYYVNPYVYQNRTSNSVNRLPIVCLCQQFQQCGCDNNNNSTFLQSVLPNGTAPGATNKTLVQITNANGTSTVVLNGTLPNGTVAAIRSTTSSSSSVGTQQAVMEFAGWWAMGLTVFATVLMV